MPYEGAGIDGKSHLLDVILFRVLYGNRTVLDSKIKTTELATSGVRLHSEKRITNVFHFSAEV